MENQGTSTSIGNGSSKKRYYIGAGVVIGLVACILFYFFYWVKTPAYSLNIIRKSIANHDLIKFEQHVDLKSLYERAYDDLVKQALGGNESSPLIMGMVTAMKGAAVDATVNQTKRYVETGNFEQNNNTTANKQQGLAAAGENAAKNLNDRTDAQGMEFKGIESTQKDGKIAVVTAKLYNRRVQKDFLLKIKMRELDTGEWQVVELSNLAEFVDDIEKATSEKLAELNKPIQEKMGKFFKPTGVVTAQLINTNNYFPIWHIRFGIEFLLPDNSNQVHEMRGTFNVLDEKNKKVLGFNAVFPNVERLYTRSDYSPEKKRTVDWMMEHSLNQFLPDEKGIIEKGIQAYKVTFVMTSLTMKDGTVFKTLRELPKVDSKN
jgi:hypothetical protein